jgi:hypothetical protein
MSQLLHRDLGQRLCVPSFRLGLLFSKEHYYHQRRRGQGVVQKFFTGFFYTVGVREVAAWTETGFLMRSKPVHFILLSLLTLHSKSTPFFDTESSVHVVRLKQHGLRSPALSFEHAASIRRRRGKQAVEVAGKKCYTISENPAIRFSN